MRLRVGASILAADFANLKQDMLRIQRAGIDLFHIDIMDGHFVPNITIGPDILRDIRKVSSLPFDVHLMIKQPFNWVNRFIAAGADMITVHVETIKPAAYRKQYSRLKSKGIKLGISLNPATPLKRIQPLLNMTDFVLMMSVNPGFGGQKFIPGVVLKIKALRKIYKGDIAVDGGINNLTAEKVIKAGANVLACGTYIFKSAHPKRIIQKIRKLGGEIG